MSAYRSRKGPFLFVTCERCNRSRLTSAAPIRVRACYSHHQHVRQPRFGTTTPVAKLSVQGAGTGTGINFQTTNSSQAPLFSILDNGNVGIGTTTPNAPLVVQGATNAGGDNILVATPGTNGTSQYGATNDAGNSIYLGMFGSNYYGISSLAGSGGIGTSNSAVVIYTDSNGASGGTHPINFSPGGYNNIKMTLTSSGNVGIGTTAPGYPLVVNGRTESNPSTSGSSVDGSLRIGYNNGVIDAGFSDVPSTNTSWIQSRNASDYSTNYNLALQPNGGTLLVGTMNGNGNTFQVQGTRYFSGNVGIGTTSPYAKLSVQGAGTGTGINFQTTNSSLAPLFSILDNGNVGIGTPSPSYKLDVSGFINADQYSGLKQAGNTVLYASSTNAETAVGQSALANYFGITSNAGETALGYQALGNATSSTADVAVGYQADRDDRAVSNASRREREPSSRAEIRGET